MTTLLERARRGECLAGVGIIDMHGHLGRVEFCIPDLSPATLVAAMDRVGIESIVVSHVRCLFSRPGLGNEAVLDAMRAFPGRILGYVVLLPTSEEAVREEMERGVANGFVGLKLHNANGIQYDEPKYEPALAIANERRMPVLFHTWGRDEEFEQFRVLAAKFPDASLLLAHSGAANEAEYVKIAQEFENIYLDVCFSTGPRGLVERLVEGAGVDKVVWGSDAIFLSITQQVGKVLAARLPEEDKIRVLSANARRILGRIRK